MAAASSPVVLPHLPPRPLLVVLAGPSGSGKSSLASAFLSTRDDFVESVSATTRAPRPGEVDGADYRFLSEAAFTEMIAADAFLEHAQVFGRHRYGTPRDAVEAAFAAGRHVIMDIDVQGAAQIRQRMPEAVQVFIVPPSTEELERRLRGRGTEVEADVQRRLREAAAECSNARSFDYLLVNDRIECAVADLQAIVRAEAMRWH